MTKIILGNTLDQSKEAVNEKKTETKVITNLFQGRTEPELENAKFPDWDIVPPSQFINPRIKNQ
ncbi:hypothetical protein ACFSJW_07790 [Flavobacterium artemisiae]|uniref:Uncharacterized protein n=1 Tax=Flavobacterium artemisiae TaxID=2126556 RepID=A0ABW4HGU4_9FLAO